MHKDDLNPTASATRGKSKLRSRNDTAETHTASPTAFSPSYPPGNRKVGGSAISRAHSRAVKYRVRRRSPSVSITSWRLDPPEATRKQPARPSVRISIWTPEGLVRLKPANTARLPVAPALSNSAFEIVDSWPISISVWRRSFHAAASSRTSISLALQIGGTGKRHHIQSSPLGSAE
jgi:hypothetical protein